MSNESGVWFHDASVSVRTGRGMEANGKIFSLVMRRLAQCGFVVKKDPRIEKDYKSLSRRHRQVSKKTPVGTLYVSAEFHAIGMSFDGWQEVIFSNPNGGRYDFGKIDKMPYQIRLTWFKFRNLIAKWMEERGFRFMPSKASWRDDPLGAFNDGWGADRFPRDASGWPAESELRLWHRNDANGVPIHHGEYRYIRHYSGRWWRVRVYGGINGMWMGICGAGITNHNASHYYSHVPPDKLRRRCVSDDVVKRRLNDMFVESINAGEFRRSEALMREAKRRGFALRVQQKQGA